MHCHTYYTTYAELSMAMVAKSLSMFPNGRVDHFVAGAELRPELGLTSLGLAHYTTNLHTRPVLQLNCFLQSKISTVFHKLVSGSFT